MNVLLTGGAGYIGSHTAVVLAQAGHEVIIFDNLQNSDRSVVGRVERISGKDVVFVEGDVKDTKKLAEVMTDFKVDSVIHFAGLKAVSESVSNPINYYSENVFGAISLLHAMQSIGVKKIVFSSSATVYGEPLELPLTESHPLSAKNPYGRTKLIIEDMLRDLFFASPDWGVGILRYFNPVGAHESGLIGESPQGTPNNLMPYVAQVASGVRNQINVFGFDYPTHDGTGIRDFIHVMDLAKGHLSALERLKTPQCFTVNLGTGIGYSVLDVIREFERVIGNNIPYNLAPRRTGDVAVCYADVSLAKAILGWSAEYDLTAMCEHAWRWENRRSAL